MISVRVSNLPNFPILFYTTEFAENGSIFDYVYKEKKQPSLQQGLDWAEQVAEGMWPCHENTCGDC